MVAIAMRDITALAALTIRDLRTSLSMVAHLANKENGALQVFQPAQNALKEPTLALLD